MCEATFCVSFKVGMYMWFMLILGFCKAMDVTSLCDENGINTFLLVM